MEVTGGDVDVKSDEQDRGQLFPSHLSEALDVGDGVFFFDDFVEGTELDVFEKPCPGGTTPSRRNEKRE